MTYFSGHMHFKCALFNHVWSIYPKARPRWSAKFSGPQKVPKTLAFLCISLPIVEGSYDDPEPGPSGSTEPGPSIKRSKLKGGEKEEKKKHYKLKKCPIYGVSVVHLRCHLIAIH